MRLTAAGADLLGVSSHSCAVRRASAGSWLRSRGSSGSSIFGSLTPLSTASARRVGTSGRVFVRLRSEPRAPQAASLRSQRMCPTRTEIRRVTGKMARHLISIDDLSDAELRGIVDRGVHFAALLSPGTPTRAAHWRERWSASAFRKPSTRTRTAFSSGALRLGAGLTRLRSGRPAAQHRRVHRGHRACHVTVLDVLVARTSGDPLEMRAWAEQRRMAVVNAMSADEHPTQALADLTTLARRFGAPDGLSVLYMGEGNNSAAVSHSDSPGTAAPGSNCVPRPDTAWTRQCWSGRAPRQTRTAPRSLSTTTWRNCPQTSTSYTPRVGRHWHEQARSGLAPDLRAVPGHRRRHGPGRGDGAPARPPRPSWRGGHRRSSTDHRVWPSSRRATSCTARWQYWNGAPLATDYRLRERGQEQHDS